MIDEAVAGVFVVATLSFVRMTDVGCFGIDEAICREVRSCGGGTADWAGVEFATVAVDEGFLALAGTKFSRPAKSLSVM